LRVFGSGASFFLSSCLSIRKRLRAIGDAGPKRSAAAVSRPDRLQGQPNPLFLEPISRLDM
jgi:hypothetical protein